MSGADLHIHSTSSDGTLSPEEIVEIAEEKGLGAISITDHDSISGIQRAIDFSQRKSIEVVPGIEFSTEYADSEVHMLGYYFDYLDPSLNRFLKKLRDSRMRRAEKIVAKLNDIGYRLDFYEISRSIEPDKSIGRPHIARAMVRRGYCSSIEDAFERFLSAGRPAYVERFKLSPFAALEMIRAANGVSSIAHPGLIVNIDTLKLIKKLKEWGLSGIEVYHSRHSQSDIDHFLSAAHELNLIPTGGSDCHGRKSDASPEIGSVSIPLENVEMLKRLSGNK